jgi:hypothetical protein
MLYTLFELKFIIGGGVRNCCRIEFVDEVSDVDDELMLFVDEDDDELILPK